MNASAAVSLLPHYRRICSWCRCDLGSLWEGSYANSYGICPTCRQRYFADLYASEIEEPIAAAELRERRVGSE